jgi:hypothetical protein
VVTDVDGIVAIANALYVFGSDLAIGIDIKKRLKAGYVKQQQQLLQRADKKILKLHSHVCGRLYECTVYGFNVVSTRNPSKGGMGGMIGEADAQSLMTMPSRAIFCGICTVLTD